METFLNPTEVLERLGLTEEMVAVDFGCGSGGWAIPLAKKLKNGTVFAIDILEEPLIALQSRARLEKISNIKTIRLDVEDTGGLQILKDGLANLVLVTNLLFQVKNGKDILSGAQRILKTGGKILVIDWNKTAKIGPENGKISPAEVKKIAQELSLKIEEEFAAGAYHWGLVLVK